MKLLIIFGVFVAVMAFLTFLPSLLSLVLDPLNISRVKSHCEKLGCTNIEIKAWPNHYGVKFKINDIKHSTKCRVIGLKIKWVGKSPEEIISNAG
jgi:uncharacterized membrane protein YdfJ with MMPL/SSD domain